MGNIRIKAILAGLAADFAGSIVVGIVLAIVIAAVARKSGDVSPQHLAVLRGNFILKFLGLVGTTFFTGVGGYVAARISKPHGFSNSLAVGVASLVLSLLLAVAAPGVTPAWKIFIGCLVTVPAAVAGGHVAGRSVA